MTEGPVCAVCGEDITQDDPGLQPLPPEVNDSWVHSRGGRHGDGCWGRFWDPPNPMWPEYD